MSRVMIEEKIKELMDVMNMAFANADAAFAVGNFSLADSYYATAYEYEGKVNRLKKFTGQATGREDN